MPRRYSVHDGGMNPFEFFFTFYSLILGLGIAELLSGFARAWRLRKLGRTAIAALMLGILVSWEIIVFWIAGWHQFRDVQVSTGSLALPFLIGGAYFVAAHMVFPDRPEEWETLDGYYESVKTRVASAMLVANLLILIVDVESVRAMIEKGMWQRLFALYIPLNASILGAYLTLMLARRRWMDVAAMGMLFAWYGWAMLRGY